MPSNAFSNLECPNCGGQLEPLPDGLSAKCEHCGSKLVAKQSTNTSSKSSNKELEQDSPRGWNWGAFFLTWIWGLGNNVWVSLLIFVPIVNYAMPFVLGAYGNKWAWEKGKWKNIEHFRKTQKTWALAGLICWIVGIFIYICIVFTSCAAIFS